jgi:RNase P subunit RPR2
MAKKSKNWRYQGYTFSIKTTEYAHRTWCDNCGEVIYIYIKKGIKIKDVMPEVPCSDCGVLQE